jgi:hypothetical protein
MADSVLTYLDAYCERAGDAGMFGEPMNLITNLFFIAAALLAGRALLLRKQESIASVNLDSRVRGNDTVMDLWLLVVFLFSIGIGSGLWHLAPTGTTLLMDVIPITLFINLYIVSALRRLFGLSWPKVALWWGVYFGAGLLAQATLPPNLLNGTIMYIPTYLALAVMAGALWRRDAPVGRVFALALGVWTASLMFRTLDMQLCPSLVIGTHFLWHTLNAWVLWRLLMVLVIQRRATVNE